MDKKLFLTDVDETLMNTEKRIPPENKAALHRLLDDGHYVAIASGRAVPSLDSLVEELELVHPNAYLVCYNGSQIWRTAPKEQLTEEHLDREIAVRIIRAANEADIHIQTYSDSHFLCDRLDEGTRYYSRTSLIPWQITNDLAADMPEQVPKLLLMDLDRPERLIAFRDSHREFADCCDVMFSCPQYLEYCPRGVNKGSALERLRHILGLPQESTIAIGDENNDLPMIRAANLGIAMKNATEEVKKAASAVTEADQNHAGVSWAIRHFIYQEI